MSLLFDATTKYVQLSNTALDQIDGMTLMMWYYANTTASGTYTAFSKLFDASNDQILIWRPSASPGPNDWNFFHKRATTNTFLKTSGDIVQANRWEWLCVLDSDGVAPKVFHGTLTSKPTETSYTSRTTGVGAVTDDSGQATNVGRAIQSGTQTFDGRIGFLAIYDRRMADAEALAHWKRPWPASNCVQFCYPGLHGVSWVDLSGKGANGTVNGSLTQSSPIPLSSPRWLFPRPGLPSAQARRISIGNTYPTGDRVMLAG